MKTTPEQRLAYKEGRRFSKMRLLIQKINVKCENSEKMRQEIDEILERLAKSPSIALHLEAIRRAN